MIATDDPPLSQTAGLRSRHAVKRVVVRQAVISPEAPAAPATKTPKQLGFTMPGR